MVLNVSQIKMNLLIWWEIIIQFVQTTIIAKRMYIKMFG